MQGTRKRPLLVCATAAQKPALKGEVAMSDSELTEGLHRGCSFFPQPLSRHAATAPRPGSLLVQCKHIVQCRTPRGAIVSMGLRGVQGGLRGEIEIFPGPPAKNVIKELSSLLFISTPQSIAKPSPSWNKVALLTAVRNSPCSCPFSVSLHPPLAALNSEPHPPHGGFHMAQPYFTLLKQYFTRS